jgi:hypothetical protein
MSQGFLIFHLIFFVSFFLSVPRQLILEFTKYVNSSVTMAVTSYKSLTAVYPHLPLQTYFYYFYIFYLSVSQTQQIFVMIAVFGVDNLSYLV